MKKLILALFIVGCNQEVINIDINHITDQPNDNEAANTINGKPIEFQALGSNGTCKKYQYQGETLGTYLNTDYTVFNEAGEGILNADGTCSTLDPDKWANIQNEVFNQSFFNLAQTLVNDKIYYIDYLPTAKCVNKVRLDGLAMLEGKNFLIEREKIGRYFVPPDGIGSYRIFEPGLYEDKIIDYMKPIREYFVKEYVVGKVCD